MIEEDLLRELSRACRLALRAAYHACDHPPQVVAKTAKCGCGACRAVLALEVVIEQEPAANLRALARVDKAGFSNVGIAQ